MIKNFFFISLVSLFIYGLLVVLDYVSFRVINKHYISNKAIEREWFINKVQKKMENANEQGYKAALYPFLFDKHEKFSELSKQKGIVPLGVQPNTQLYICDEGYGLIKFTSDKFGFRNKNSVWQKENFNNSTLVIGDSFAAGHCLPDGLTITDQINKYIPVINIASAGNSSSTYYALASSLIPKIKPKRVLLVFSINDNHLLSNLDFNELKKSYFLNDSFTQDYFLDRNKKIILNPKINEIYSKTNKNSSLDNFFTELHRGRPNVFVNALKYFTLPTFRRQINILWNNIFFKIPEFSKLAIDEANKECKLNNCKLTIAYIPGNKNIRKDLYSSKFNKSLKEYSFKKKIEYFDFEEIIYSNVDFKNYYSEQGSHLSIFGAIEFSRIYLEKFVN